MYVDYKTYPPKIYLLISTEMLCAIWYHLRSLKNAKNTHGEVLLLAKLQVFSIQHYFTKSNTPLWVFFSRFLNRTNGTKSRKASQLISECFM